MLPSENPSSVDPVVDASVSPQLEALPGDAPLSASSDPLDLIPAIAPPVIPPRDPAWSGWDVLIVAVLTFASIVLCTAALALGTHWLAPQVNMNSVAAEITIAAQLLAYLGIALFMIVMIEGKYHVPFWQAIRWNWPQSGFKFVGLGVALLLMIDVTANFLPMPKKTPFDQFFLKPRDAIVMSIFAITLGPLMEELFFRGLLYPVLVRRLGIFWGIVLTALPFGLLHMFQYGYSWAVVLLIFLMGTVCTIVRWKTGSVAASFLVHVGYNATEMFMLMLATDGFRHMEKVLG